MLINLLKETLSFKQLDMMDESWLVTRIFERTAFVAGGGVGYRVRIGGSESVERVLKRIGEKKAGEWTYEDLLLLRRYGNGKGKGG